jgi:hypothetical protein
MYLMALSDWCVQAGMLPPSFPDLEIRSKELFGLTSFALSLLLVSYSISIVCHMFPGAPSCAFQLLTRCSCCGGRQRAESRVSSPSS